MSVLLELAFGQEPLFAGLWFFQSPKPQQPKAFYVGSPVQRESVKMVDGRQGPILVCQLINGIVLCLSANFHEATCRGGAYDAVSVAEDKHHFTARVACLQALVCCFAQINLAT